MDRDGRLISAPPATFDLNDDCTPPPPTEVIYPCRDEFGILHFSSVGPCGGPGGGGPKNGPPAIDKTLQAFEKQLAKDGIGSLEKSRNSILRQLQEHEAKLPSLKHKSSVEREIRTFKRQIEAIDKLLGKK